MQAVPYLSAQLFRRHTPKSPALFFQLSNKGLRAYLFHGPVQLLYQFYVFQRIDTKQGTLPDNRLHFLLLDLLGYHTGLQRSEHSNHLFYWMFQDKKSGIVFASISSIKLKYLSLFILAFFIAFNVFSGTITVANPVETS